VSRNIIQTVGVLVFVAMSVACGKSAEQQAAEDAAQTAAAAATDMGKALEGYANALSGGAEGTTTVEPVTFQSLIGILPEVSGWEREKPRGERMTIPVPFSQAEVGYRKGDANIDVKIIDTGFAQLLFAPFSMLMTSGYSRESSDGYEKAVTINGHPGLEQWRSDDSGGELTVAVGKRYMVTIEGSQVPDAATLRTFASAMNLGALASLK
jgi:hypothetical protein